MDTWIAFTFWLLWIMLLRTWVYIQCLSPKKKKNLNKWALKGNCWLANSLSTIEAGQMMQATGCSCIRAKSPRSSGERASALVQRPGDAVWMLTDTLCSALSTPVSRTTYLKNLLQYMDLRGFLPSKPKPFFPFILPFFTPPRFPARTSLEERVEAESKANASVAEWKAEFRDHPKCPVLNLEM